MSMLDGLIDGAIKRRKVVLGVALIASIFGYFAFMAMPRESNPNIPVPFIAITVPYPGVSPEDSERLLVRPLERNLQSLEGLKEMNAVAVQNAAIVVLEFEINFNKEKVLNDVRAKVDLARGRFPPDAEEPIIEENNVNDDPVIGIMLSGFAPERTMFKAATDLQDRLESLPGVLRTDLSGGREEVLEVTVDPLRMQTANVTAGELAQVIARNNQLIPAGDLRTAQSRFAVKIPGVVETPDDILRLPIKRSGDRLITIGDIGSVHRTFKEPDRTSRFNGNPAFSIEVVKRAGSNIIDTVETVRTAVAEEQARWPSTIKVDYTFDESETIFRRLSILESGLITATLLVMLIVIASLGTRQGLMVGVAIPVCFMLAFLGLQALGVTLNQMVMFGLILAVGILVDGGIVVVEYADRKMAEGLPKEQAFAAAGKRMFWPVVNGTLTTLCAFIPFMFWNSIPGKFMSYLPLTLFFVLGASIFVALIFTPALGSVFGRKAGVDEHELAEIEKSEHGDPRQMTGFMGWYANALWFAGHHPFRVTAVTLAIVAIVVTGFASQPHRTEFFLDDDPEWVAVWVKARGNISTEVADTLVRQVEARLQNVKGVDSVYVRAGKFSGQGFGAPPNDSIGRLQIDYVEFEERVALGVTGKTITEDIRNRIQNLPGIMAEIRLPQAGPPVGKDIQVELRSSNVAALQQAADKIKAHLAADKDLMEQEDNRPSPGIEWNLAVDRTLAGRFGVDVASVGQAIQFTTNGVLVGRFRPDDAKDELDIRLRFPGADRSLSSLSNLYITTPQGPVPASYFVRTEPVQQVTSLNRRDSQRLVVLQANTISNDIAANVKIAELKTWLDDAGIDPSVRWRFRGADEEGQKAAVFFQFAMAATLFMMGVILLWQFNSFYGVVVTLSAVLLSTVGVLLGVWINLAHTYDYISVIMLGTGIIALAGVVVGHNIVLVDTFYQLRRGGFEADEAAMRSAVQRFRPVMLTTIVTIVGLLPLMFQLHPNFGEGHLEYKAPGSEQWVQLSAAVVWGLTFSTVLTLFLTPAALAAPLTLQRRGRWVLDQIQDRTGLKISRPRPVRTDKPASFPGAAE